MTRTPLHSTLRFSLILTALACNDGSLTTKNVNATPEAVIILPDSNDGGEVEDGTTVLFRAVVSDADYADRSSLLARWRVDSNAEYACDYEAPDENGETSCEIAIVLGMEKVIVEVKDQNNSVGSDEYLLNVIETTPPEIELLSPTVNGLYKENVVITFEAVVSDEEDNSEELVISWETDLEGDLELEGEVSSFGLYESEGMLLEGTHVVTATVTDTNGKSASDSVEIVVGPAVAPVLEFVDIQNTAGFSLDEAFDGQTIVCGASATHPEDAPLTWTYTWNNDAGTDITVDPSSNSLTLDYAGQGVTGGESVTCTATVTDGETAVSDSDSVILVDCSPFATEIPYDGIDSNCDGLESLNDQDGDGQPDDPNQNFDADHSVNDGVDARIGIECYGELQVHSNGSYYLLYCDTDYYWKGSQQFCVDHGYDGLATAKDDEEYQFLVTGLDTHRGFTSATGPTRGNVFVGLTRGPDCAPVANTLTGFTSVCSQDVRDYYWIDGSDTSYMEADIGAYWSDGEMAYLNPAAGDFSMHNNDEHCAFLKAPEPHNNINDYGYWDLYCDVTSGQGGHDGWSLSHTTNAVCIKR